MNEFKKLLELIRPIVKEIDEKKKEEEKRKK